MRVTVHIPDKLASILRQTANNEGISLSAVTARALELYLRQKRRRQAGNRLLELIHSGGVGPDAREELEKGRLDDRS